MYKIGDFSQIGQVSVRMMRHYDKLGLLKPGYTDQWTGYRYYTLDQLPRLHQILALRDLGLSLEQIADLLDDPRAEKQLYEILQTKQQAIQQQLAAEQARLERVTARLRQIEQVHTPIPYEVALKSRPAQPIIAGREVVPHLSQMGDIRDRLFRQLYAILAEQNITPGPELAIYHLQGYAEENIEMSLAVEVDEGISWPDTEKTFTAYTLPALPLAASIVYQGEMWHIPEVVTHLYRWLGMNGYTSAGPYRELHLFGRELEMFATDPPAQGVIEVLVPIEKL
jgi:DNA-binding transcriptional MerR regulator